MTIREAIASALTELDALEAGHQKEKDALLEITQNATHPKRGTVEVRECQECRDPYPEWSSIPKPSICPSCILVSSLPKTGGVSGRALRHDTQPDVAAAAIIHESLRQHALLIGQLQDPEWESAPGWMRSWRIETARAVAGGVRDGEMAYARWYAAREAEGWKNGAVIDPIKRLAPMVEWKALHPVEQTKYRLAVAIAIALG